MRGRRRRRRRQPGTFGARGGPVDRVMRSPWGAGHHGLGTNGKFFAQACGGASARGDRPRWPTGLRASTAQRRTSESRAGRCVCVYARARVRACAVWVWERAWGACCAGAVRATRGAAQGQLPLLLQDRLLPPRRPVFPHAQQAAVQSHDRAAAHVPEPSLHDHRDAGVSGRAARRARARWRYAFRGRVYAYQNVAHARERERDMAGGGLLAPRGVLVCLCARTRVGAYVRLCAGGARTSTPPPRPRAPTHGIPSGRCLWARSRVPPWRGRRHSP